MFSTRAALVGGRYSNVQDPKVNICWHAWLIYVKEQLTEYSETTKITMTLISSEESMIGPTISWHSEAAKSDLVNHFSYSDFFLMPEKKEVLSDPVKAWNAGKAYALAGDMV